MTRIVATLLALLALPAPSMAEILTGSATYLQRIALPPDAVVEIVLEDVSLADAPAKRLATYRIDSPGAPPYRFAFHYDPEQIDPAHSYGLRATVRAGDKLLMTTDTAYPVLTRGAEGEHEMVMRMVAEPTDQTPNADFVNTYWKIVTLGGSGIEVAEGKREPHLILRTDRSYNATVGCNMIRGGYELDDGSLRFLPGATTMMACPPPLDALERSLVETLGAASAFGVDGETMELLDAAGGTLATFVAVYF